MFPTEELINEMSREEIAEKQKSAGRLIKGMSKIMSAFGNLILGKKRVPIEIKLSKLSYTDHQKIVASISPEEACTFTKEEVAMALKVKVSHECQHILSTVMDSFSGTVEYIVNMWDTEAKKQGRRINTSYAFQLAKHIVNGIEDGRIENILYSKMKKLKKYYKWYRGSDWKNYEVQKEDDLYAAKEVVNELHNIATMGIYCKGFKKAYSKGDLAYDYTMMCKEYAIKARNSVTCEECMECCKKIAEIITPIAIEYTEISKLDELIRQFIEQLIQDNANREKSYQASKQSQELNSDDEEPLFSISIPSKDSEEESEEDTNSSESGSGSEEKESDEDDNENNNNSSSSSDNSKENEDTEASSNNSEGNSEENEEEAGDEEKTSSSGGSSEEDAEDGTEDDEEDLSSGGSSEQTSSEDESCDEDTEDGKDDSNSNGLSKDSSNEDNSKEDSDSDGSSKDDSNEEDSYSSNSSENSSSEDADNEESTSEEGSKNSEQTSTEDEKCEEDGRDSEESTDEEQLLSEDEEEDKEDKGNSGSDNNSSEDSSNEGSDDETLSSEENSKEKGNSSEEDSENSEQTSLEDESCDGKEESSEEDMDNMDMSESDVDAEAQQSAEELESEVQQTLESARKNLKELEKTEGDGCKDDYSLTEKELGEIDAIYKDESTKGYEEKRREDYPSSELPLEQKTQGANLKRQMETMLKNKETYTQRNMTSGRLDKRNIHKLVYASPQVFMRKGTPSNWDGCMYVLKDGSGSMYGDKNREASKAMSLIEQAAKSLMPLKLVEFSSYQEVVHTIIKDWNENNLNYNYSWSYYNNEFYGGGNKDGYSIRLATKELLKRPEKQKLLVVLSDGLPSDYDYTGNIEWGPSDVKSAVEEARRNGIIVMSIYFGSANFIESNKEKYAQMYEKDYIGAETGNITNELVKILKKFVRAF